MSLEPGTAWKNTWIDFVPEFKAGDPPPETYIAWHEWARVQGKAGLKQTRCPRCTRWRFPQELAGCCAERRP
jgi:hypothetical protein